MNKIKGRLLPLLAFLILTALIYYSDVYSNAIKPIMINYSKYWPEVVGQGSSNNVQDPTKDSLVHDPTKDSLVQDPTKDSLVHHPTKDSLVHDPTKDSLVHDPTKDSLVQDPKKDSLVHDPTKGSLVQDLKKDSLVHDPTEDSLVHHPTKDSLVHDPKKDSLVHDPTKGSLVQDPKKDSLVHDPKKDSLVHDPKKDSVMQSEVLSMRHFEDLNQTQTQTHNNTWKTIVFWDRWFNADWSGRFGTTNSTQLWQEGCPSWRCVFTYNKTSILQKADAVLFRNKATKWWTLPRGDVKEGQRWVLVDVEAPPPGPTPNTPTDRLSSTLVNWTMTYHSHSDVVAFYGYFLSLNASVRPLRPNQMSEHKEAVAGVRRLLADGVTLEEAMGPSLNTYVNKTRVVAWMSSHCPTRSRREEYVHHLNKYLPVDRYGSCGNLSCGRRHPLESHCWQTVLTHYSFYMAMENALCLDYISEKLYNPLLYNIVPVVWGGADYSNYLPPNSYIDARQYHPEELANLLLNLHNDPVAYGRYHLWRAYLRPMVRGSMCELCHLLHTDTSHHHYHSIATARHLRGQCLFLPTKLFHPRHSTAWKQVIASNHSENKHKIPPQW